MRKFGYNTDPDRQQSSGKNVYCDECGRLIWHGKTQQWVPHHNPIYEIGGFTEAGPDCGASHWLCEDCLDAIETNFAIWEDRLLRRAHGRIQIIPNLVLWEMVAQNAY